jgi:hypothetical protein
MEYNFPHFPRIFSIAEQIRDGDASSPSAKRPNGALWIRAYSSSF